MAGIYVIVLELFFLENVKEKVQRVDTELFDLDIIANIL